MRSGFSKGIYAFTLISSVWMPINYDSHLYFPVQWFIFNIESRCDHPYYVLIQYGKGEYAAISQEV